MKYIILKKDPIGAHPLKCDNNPENWHGTYYPEGLYSEIHHEILQNDPDGGFQERLYTPIDPLELFRTYPKEYVLHIDGETFKLEDILYFIGT